MEYINFGSAGLRVSPIALDLALRGQPDVAVAQRIVERALDLGVNFIDCANRYSPLDAKDGFGTSEEILGRALKGRRDNVVITSKVQSRIGPGPNDYGSSRLHILREVENSLRRLQTDYIDVYLLHAFDATTPLEEIVRTMDDLVRSGDWKLRVATKGKAVKSPQLYNLREDIAEKQDVAAQHPEKVSELLALIEATRQDLGDDATGVAGANLRKPGFVEDAVPLTKN